ncbi:hypothetical protein BsWGS_04212 [Bradybaena similaris]
MFSDSEDEEAPPAFIECLDADTESTKSTTNQQCSRIDALLAEHRREAGKQQQLRDQLMAESVSCKEIPKVATDKDLVPEHVDLIQKMKVMSIRVKTDHPGLPVFNAENFGCLFSDNISPVNYLKNTDTIIDKRWTKFSLDDLDALTPQNVPNILTPTNFSAIIQWLFDLLSVHHCYKTAVTIEKTLKAILNHFHFSRDVEYRWKLSALDLLRLLVNLGADPQELTESQTAITQDEIRHHLVKVSDTNVQQPQKEGVGSERFRAILCVLHVALQGRSLVAKEDLNLMFYMLAKAALDKSLDTMLRSNFQHCFTAIVNHYSDRDWPFVVPELCRQLSKVTDHHHNQSYLASLIYSEPRGSYLQMWLSYAFLHNHLRSTPLELGNSKLHHLQLVDVLELGVTAQTGQPCTLAVRLHQLVKKDLYKTYSILTFLELSVGDITRRAAAEKRQFEHLLNQMNLVLQTMRDRVHELDLSTVKDRLSDLTRKWSMALQDQRMMEGSIFPWATATTHQRVETEILMDRQECDK